LKDRREIWKAVVGFDGAYEVSDLGRVRSIDRVIVTSAGVSRAIKGAIKGGRVTPYGYHRVNLCVKDKRTNKFVHRLVMEAFLGESELMTDHIDGIKTNNNVDNLEYVTPRENARRYHASKGGLPTGVSVGKITGEYCAKILINRKAVHLGNHKTIEGARNAYLEKLESIGEKEG